MHSFGTTFLFMLSSARQWLYMPGQTIAPKVLIISMFDKEAANWLSDDSALQFERTISVPGLSRGYPNVYCTAPGDVCQVIAGTALVNAALTISALTSSALFDFSTTYFLITGIAGVSPKTGTLGTVAFAKYAIQVDLQLEFDAREIPSTWNFSYVPMGADRLGSYSKIIYGSEVFEINDNLRQMAMVFAKKASLNDSDAAAQNRALYTDSPGDMYHAATQKPCVLEGDVTASNVFFHGKLLTEGFEDVVKLYTSGRGSYCMTAQEDTAILAALLRAALEKRVDFSRIILMRAGSNFDRPHSTNVIPEIPFQLDHGGFKPACRNLYLTGLEVVQGILRSWSSIFEKGVRADNYVGDIFSSLGGTPDFGPEK